MINALGLSDIGAIEDELRDLGYTCQDVVLDGVEFDDVAQIECSGPDGEIEVVWLEDAQRMADAAALSNWPVLTGARKLLRCGDPLPNTP